MHLFGKIILNANLTIEFVNAIAGNHIGAAQRSERCTGITGGIRI